jgi:hypothetical protein
VLHTIVRRSTSVGRHTSVRHRTGVGHHTSIGLRVVHLITTIVIRLGVSAGVSAGGYVAELWMH